MLLRSSMWIWSYLNWSPLKKRHWTSNVTHLGKFVKISYRDFNKNDILVPSLFLDGAEIRAHLTLFSFCDCAVSISTYYCYFSLSLCSVLPFWLKTEAKLVWKKDSSAKWRRRMFCLQLTFKARMSKTLKTHNFFTKELVFSILKLQLVVCNNEMSVVLHRWSIFQEWRWWGTSLESVKQQKDWQKTLDRRAQCYIPEPTASFFRCWGKASMEFCSGKSKSIDLSLFGGCREGGW